MKVAVTGSSGLIGTALTASLRADGHQVVRLVRRPPRAADEIRWDPRAADAGDPVLAGVDAVRAPGRRRGRRPALDRRLQGGDPVQPGADATEALRRGPGGCVRPGRGRSSSASAIGWYGDTGGAAVTEDAPGRARRSSPGSCADWEAAAAPGRDAGIRVAHLRSGLVLGAGGGVLGRLALAGPPRRAAPLGDGRQ